MLLDSMVDLVRLGLLYVKDHLILAAQANYLVGHANWQPIKKPKLNDAWNQKANQYIIETHLLKKLLLFMKDSTYSLKYFN